MEIKEGMYVRTNTGIRRVVYINDGCITFDEFMSNGTSLFNFIEEKELDMYLIKEPSYRIIDLIQKDDFVNGHRVIQVDRESLELDIENSMYGCGCETICDRDIKTIVTKEQFANMEYRIGE